MIADQSEKFEIQRSGDESLPIFLSNKSGSIYSDNLLNLKIIY
jgi:hypothetical protein